MRITKIEIENINSLKGYWCIDLKHPDYEKNHNLFVICGVTGSGKTTILDAITLALYGRTPRQTSFGDTNEIMTRQTGYCMAKVTYECRKGTFVSMFYQNKAKGKSSGSLQKAYGLITNLQTGESTEQLSITNLASRTADIIQLDYSQFIRSIMLAQGDFDSFISEKPRARADILAKINGTEKYKQFANRLWEKANTEIEECQKQEKALNEIQVLTEDEISEINGKIKSNENRLKEISKSLDLVNKANNWILDLNGTKQKKEIAEKNRNEYLDKAEQFTNDKKRLEKSKKAKNCSAEYSKYSEIYGEQESDKKKVSLETVNLQKLQEEFIALDIAAKTAMESFQKKKEELPELETLWTKVRDLDSKIAPVQEKVDSTKTAKEEAEKELKDCLEKVENLKKEVEVLGSENKELKLYLDEHAKDEQLSSLIVIFEQKQKQFISYRNKIDELTKELEEGKKELNQLEEKSEKLDKEYKDLDKQLQELVKTEYLSISKLLRGDLKKGKPCPVCGSEEHPVCDSEKQDNQIDDNTKNLGKTVSDLGKKCEEIASQLNSISVDISGIDAKCKNIEKSLKTEEEQQQIAIEETNKELSGWKESINNTNSVSKLTELIELLSEKSKTYEEKFQKYEDNKNQIESKTEIQNNIDLKSLKTKKESAEKNYSKACDEISALLDQRKDLFGDKDVNKESVSFKEELNTLETKSEEVEKTRRDADQNISALNERINTYNKSIQDRSSKLEATEKSFMLMLEKNGFDSIEEYENCLISDSDYEKLLQTEEELNLADTKTQLELENSTKEYNKKLEEKVTDKTEAELQIEKEHLNTEDTELRDINSSFRTQLETNKENQGKYNEAKKVLEAAMEKKPVWEQIKKFIGVKDGSDFQEFVQALAFKKLLKIANDNVFAISGKYTLLQKENEVDFMVHDVNYPDPKDDRPISNMSGGEKFIISLSLALGIAELASQNVRVDSLFLDEGFGTLSGEPLYEAINALKTLQNKGKMLGIITHVEAVINEFDQKITASKERGGVSSLSGSGVSQEKQ